MVIVMKCFIVPLKILLLTYGALKINSYIIHFYIFLYSFISFEKQKKLKFKKYTGSINKL